MDDSDHKVVPENVDYEGEPSGYDGSDFKMPNSENLGGGNTEGERAPESPTTAADAASERIGSRLKRGFIDIGVINASAIGFALGAWADSRAAMLGAAAVGTVATGKFVGDLVSIGRHNKKDEAIVMEADPEFVAQRDRLIINEAEFAEEVRKSKEPKLE